MSLTVVSCGISKNTISLEALDVIKSADVLYGGKRMLEWFPDVSAEYLPMTARFASELDDLAELSKSKTVVVLASGCLLYTSDAADEEDSVDFGWRRGFEKQNKKDVEK
eukprot:TRINITY_DN50810_c0_g1_i1.p2 TRINITY_DN50810_c0_g1~~TRINITY_DN50810_c0_g1_i1.p2  ORF type:complete len:109 (-),score=12.73 TRINITY_DN50810_c0_g1_i1:21-347(-)